MSRQQRVAGLLERRPQVRLPGFSSATQAPVTALMAAAQGFWAAATGLFALAVPLLLAWATSDQTQASWTNALRVASGLWLLAHGVPFALPLGQLTIWPILLGLFPLWLCWLAGKRIAAGAQLAERSPMQLARELGPVLASFIGGYALSILVVAWASAAGPVQPRLGAAVGLGVLISGFGVSAGVLRTLLHRVGRRFRAGCADLLRLPGRVRRQLRPAAYLVASLIGAGLLLTVLSLLLNAERIWGGYQVLNPGVVGGVVLTLAQLGFTANIAGWAVAFIAGPGFAVGVGAQLSPMGSSIVSVPLIPVLGGLPEPGPLGSWWLLVMAIPVALSGVLSWRVARAAVGVRNVVKDLAVFLGLALLGVTIFLFLGRGQAAGIGLVVLGPNPFEVAAALAVEFGVGAALGGWLGRR